MTDEEFWEDVAASLIGPQWDDDDAGDDIDSLNADPCPECGSTGACGWDSEGRPMIHAIRGDDA